MMSKKIKFCILAAVFLILFTVGSYYAIYYSPGTGSSMQYGDDSKVTQPQIEYFPIPDNHTESDSDAYDEIKSENNS